MCIRDSEKTGITLSGNQFSYFGFQRKGNVKIAPATDDMAKAVKGAGIIIVATVAIAHEDVFRQLIPCWRTVRSSTSCRTTAAPSSAAS